MLISFALLFGSLYPLTQIYQLEEDTRRGDRTLAVRAGIDRSLGLAHRDGRRSPSCGVRRWPALPSGWRQAATRLSRWAGARSPAAAWAVVLLPWWRHRAGLDPAAHQAGMHRALAAWAITDMAVLFAWAR